MTKIFDFTKNIFHAKIKLHNKQINFMKKYSNFFHKIKKTTMSTIEHKSYDSFELIIYNNQKNFVEFLFLILFFPFVHALVGNFIFVTIIIPCIIIFSYCNNVKCDKNKESKLLHIKIIDGNLVKN